MCLSYSIFRAKPTLKFPVANLDISTAKESGQDKYIKTRRPFTKLKNKKNEYNYFKFTRYMISSNKIFSALFSII